MSAPRPNSRARPFPEFDNFASRAFIALNWPSLTDKPKADAGWCAGIRYSLGTRDEFCVEDDEFAAVEGEVDHVAGL
jgi:hypothetical protein